MDDCLRGPSRKYSFKVEKMKTIDPIQSFVEFPRPRGPMRNTVGRKVPKLRPNNNDLANYDGIEVIRVRKITRTVKKNKLEIPKGGKRPNTKAAVKKKRGAAAKKTGQAKTAYILQSDEKQSTEDPKTEGSNNWLFWKRWFSSDPQTK
nr:uncharacterized protein LOC108021222 [Drosophila suzukii]